MTKTYLTGCRLLATFITLACAVALTNTATAQVVSPNGKVEWREKGKGFAVVYHNGGNEQEVLEIANVGMLMKDGGGRELALNPNLMLYKPFPLLFSDFRFQFASLCTTNFWGF